MDSTNEQTLPGAAAAAWGIAGVTLLLLNAIGRLLPIAVRGISDGLTPPQWALLAGWCGFMGYFEGYKGFQRGFSPRVVARAAVLARRPVSGWAVLAPLFCMGLIHASRKRLITSWAVTLMVVGLIVSVRHLDQPYRGVVDAGVVLGLGWGLAAIAVQAVQTLRGRAADVAVDLPTAG